MKTKITYLFVFIISTNFAAEVDQLSKRPALKDSILRLNASVNEKIQETLSYMKKKAVGCDKDYLHDHLRSKLDQNHIAAYIER